jgi:hypothetical protein
MKSIRFGNSILCEHVVRGEHNKQTLINVFSGDIIVSALPAKLHLGLYLEIIPDQDWDLMQVSLELLLGQTSLAQVTMEFPNAKKSYPASVSLPIFELGTDVDAIIRVMLRQEGYKDTVALKKRIFKGNIPGTISPTA